MGFSLGSLGKKIADFGSRVYDQANPFDGGRSYTTRQVSRPVQQPRDNRPSGISIARPTQQPRVSVARPPQNTPRITFNAAPTQNLRVGRTLIPNTTRTSIPEIDTRGNKGLIRNTINYGPEVVRDIFTRPSAWDEAPKVNVGAWKGSGIVEDFINSPQRILKGTTQIGTGEYKKGFGNVGAGLVEGPLGFIPIGKTAQIGTRLGVKAGAKIGAKEGAVYGGGYGATDAMSNDARWGDVARQGAIGAVTGGVGGAFLGGAMPVAGAGIKKTAQAVSPKVRNVIESVRKTPLMSNADGFVQVGRTPKKLHPEDMGELTDYLDSYYGANPRGDRIALEAEAVRIMERYGIPLGKTVAQNVKNIEKRLAKESKPSLWKDEVGAVGKNIRKETPESQGKPKVSQREPEPVQNLSDSSLNSTPTNNLGDTLILDRFKNRPQVAAKKPETPELVAKIDDDNFVKQMTNDLGISETTARKLVQAHNKPALATNLYGSKEYIRSASNPDAYANKIMNEASARGRNALNENTAAPQVAKTPELPKVTAKPVNQVTGEIIETPPVTKSAPVVTSTPAKSESPDTELGKIVESFYDANKGDVKIGFRALQDLGKRVSKRVDVEYQKIGSDFNSVARKVQEGVRNGVTKLEDAGLTPQEANILRKAQAEMNYIRRRASLGTKEIGQGDFGEMYIPQQISGKNGGERAFEGFRATKPGSENVRKNKIDAEDLDYSTDTIGDYIVQYGDTKASRLQRVVNGMKRNNPDLDEEQLTAGATKLVDIQNGVNKLKTKIGAFGFGARKTLSDGQKLDTARDLNDLGKTLGKQQQDINGVPHGLTNGDKLNSVYIGDKKAGDFIGLNQWRDADSYAGTQTKKAGGDRKKLAESVRQRLEKDYDISTDDVDFIVGGISRIAADVDDKFVAARLASSYKMAAKQQALEKLQTVNITNNKMRNIVSDLTNQVLREGTIEQELSAKAVKATLRTTNAIFRKLNVSSAINELGDVASFKSAFGKYYTGVPNLKIVKEFGLGNIDPAIETYVKQVEAGKSWKTVAKSINNATNLYRFVETYKMATIANASRKMHSDNGLTGDALTKAVLDDYRNLALPVDAFTKTFLENAPLFTQYMTWGARNLQKEGRLATGKLDTGILGDKTKLERIARNAYANLPAKTVFWLASNGLKGTAIATAFGLTDFTGLTGQDYSGIQEQDKSLFDKTTQNTSISTTMSLLNTVIQSWEKEQLKDKYKDEDYNPYENNNFGKTVKNLVTPQFIKNIDGAMDMFDKGYSENAGGRLQYSAPDDAFNTAKAYVFGKGNTENARDYSGRKNIQDRISEGQNAVTSVLDMAKEQLGLQDTKYNRPLSEVYNDKFKESLTKVEDKYGRNSVQSKQAINKWVDIGRKYNTVLDNFKKSNPNEYKQVIDTYGDDVLTPEKWRVYGAKSEIFDYMKDRKKLEAKDLGRTIDPVYELSDDKAKLVVQHRSMYTGDDMRQQQFLYRQPWYEKFKADEKKFNDSFDPDDKDAAKKSARVKEWRGYSDQLYSAKDKYPLVTQQQAITDKYGFGSDESKNWYKANREAYTDQKAKYDDERFALVNKMRKLEGAAPLTADEFMAKVEFPSDSADVKGYGYGGGKKYTQELSGSPDKYAISTTPKGSLSKVSVNTKSTRGRKITAYKATKPKVTIKKSQV